ncbi:MAG: hypothetical protein QW572_04335 [Candidatus Nitrosocaldus sp.]
MELPLPAIIIGIGGAGARIARMMMNTSALDTMLISSNANDLIMEKGDEKRSGRRNGYDDDICTVLDPSSHLTKTVPRIERVLLNTGVLNPSPYTIRGSLLASESSIRTRLIGYNTFIIVANLAGRNGVAVAPLLADMIKANTDSNVRLIIFAIMPFGFESDRLFRAGVTLKKLSEMSDCTIVVDNDSFLANNPDLSIEECYRIANGILLEVFNMIMLSSEVKGLNMLSAGIDDGDGIDAVVKNAVRMLYSNTKPDKVKSALLYVVDGGTEDVSIGLIDSLAKRMSSILGEYRDYVMVKTSMMSRGLRRRGYGREDDDENSNRVGISSNSSGNSIGTGGVIGAEAHDSSMYSAVLLAEVTGISKFDSYDPLSILPRECMLDWEYSESEIRLNVESLTALPNLE